MTIEIDENDLHAFLDGQLAAEQEAIVLAWLEFDPDARRRLHDYAEQKLLTAIGAADMAHDSDPEHTRELARKLADELGTRLHRSLGRRPMAWLRQAAAIVALVAAGWTTNELYHHVAADRLPTYVVEATGAHLVFAEGPVPQVGTASPTGADLARLLSARLGEQIDIPELSPIGLKLVGGRVMGGLEHPLAGLVYEDREGHRLTICLSPRNDGPADGLHMAEVGGVRVGYWSNGEQSYVIVADTSETQLEAIVAQLTRAQPYQDRHY
ncbi:anti-sigma factor family protein [Skermanella pratensis]|uniref:anti-sigma factor family protein n=1 Tax=Skermanella pratensis TaxID=2233999 RepID=UPI0013015A10|nr:anti-sigma factor [Skermanella pratensis]